MTPDFTPVPNDLFEAVLKFKCPASQKEVIFAVIRPTEGCCTNEIALSISCLSKFLKTDRSDIAKRLKSLIEANVLRETSSPGYKTARHIEINLNFKEWITPEKKEAEKGKTSKNNLPLAQENSLKDSVPEIFFPKNPETTTVAISTTHPVGEPGALAEH